MKCRRQYGAQFGQVTDKLQRAKENFNFNSEEEEETFFFIALRGRDFILCSQEEVQDEEENCVSLNQATSGASFAQIVAWLTNKLNAGHKQCGGRGSC